MAKVKSDDTFLVNRNDITYSVETQDLMAKIKDDDYMVVNRGDVAYKVTGAEVIDSLIPELKINSVTLSTNDPRENYEILCTVDYEGGTNPAVVTFQWGSYDGTTETEIEGAILSSYTVTGDLVGKYLYCKATVTDTQPKTVSAQSPYTTSVVIEDTYAPALSSVTVVDDNPGIGSRFENKTFDANARLAKDGKPTSTKTFVATVNGTLETAIETSPIVSTTTEIISGDWETGTFIAGSPDQPIGRMAETNTKGTYIAAIGLRKNYSDDPDPDYFTMHSVDFGATWNPSTVVGYDYRGAYAVAFSPELNRAVAVTPVPPLGLNNQEGRPAVFYSDDEGRSWIPAPNAPIQEVEFVNSGYGANGEPLLICGGQANLYSSPDGLNWIKINTPTGYNGELWPPRIHDIKYSNGRWVIAAEGANNNFQQPDQVFKDQWYSDNGFDWKPSPGQYDQYGYSSQVATDGKGTWVISKADRGVLVSTDNALNWEVYPVSGGNIQYVEWCGDKFIACVPDRGNNPGRVQKSVWWSADGMTWTSVVGLGSNADGTAPFYNSVNYLNRRVFLGRSPELNHVPADNMNSAVKMTSLTGTGFDKPITRVTLQDDTNLKYLVEGDSIVGDITGTVAIVRDVNLDSNSIDCTELIQTWQINETITGPVRKIDTASKHVIFNNSGVVTGLSDDPMVPAYTTTDVNPTLTLTFSQFIDGQETDTVLPAGTALSVCVTAENTIGTSGPICGAVTPVAVTSGGGNPFVTPAAPVAINGYYPLYATEEEANAAGDGTSHTHVFDSVTYYMPNPHTIYHGNYDSSSSGY